MNQRLIQDNLLNMSNNIAKIYNIMGLNHQLKLSFELVP